MFKMRLSETRMTGPVLYADYNATTPLCPAAIAGMTKAFEVWGNPSSAHQVGRRANELLESARRAVAEKAGVQPQQVVFTSGGSEANALALMGSRFLEGEFRLLTSRVEHSSVRDTAAFLQSNGAQVEFAPVLGTGELDWNAFVAKVASFRPHLVSLMTANNETGVLFPIPEIASLCEKDGILLHTDAVQAFGKVPASYFTAAPLVSISAHKIHGPKGIGALLLRRGLKLVPTHYGGSQEVKRRGGTENMIGIAGFGGAASAMAEPSAMARIAELRDRFEARLTTELEGISVQGSGVPRLPNTSNVRFFGIPSEILLGALDLAGVCVSAGSACSSGSISPSHVLLEMGLTSEEARQCVRFSWSPETPDGAVDTVATLVIREVVRIRARRKR